MSREWETGKVGIDLGNVLNVLATALYGNDPKCALRENLQNAHDACLAWMMDGGDGFNLQIDVEVDKKSKYVNDDDVEVTCPSLVVRDRGIGMTKDEVVDCLAKIGGTSKTKVDQIKEQDAVKQRELAEEQIGRFGLGFLSGFIISDRIEISTRKDGHRAVEAVFTANTEFRFRETDDAAPRGTQVRLFLLERFSKAKTGDDDEVVALLNPDELESVIRQYCDLLRFPFFLHRQPNDTSPKRITQNRPPWLDGEPRETDYLAFLKHRLPETNTPLAIFPINISSSIPVGQDHVDVKARGVVYIPDPPPSEHQHYGQIDLYVRRMFILEDKDQLFPRWAQHFCNGVIETPSLTVTLDRNDIVRQDKVYFELRKQLGQQIIDGMCKLAKDKEASFKDLIAKHDRRIRESALIAEDGRPSNFFRAIAAYLPVTVVSSDHPAPGALMPLRKYLKELAQTTTIGTQQKREIRFFSHQSRSMLQDIISQERTAVIDAADRVQKEFIEAYSVIDDDVTIVNIGDRHLADYATNVSSQEAERWQPFCAYFKSLTHQGDQVLPEVKSFQPYDVPALMLAVSNETAREKREQLNEFIERFGAVGAVGEAIQEQLMRLGPERPGRDGGTDIGYVLFLNAGNPLMRQLMRFFENSKSTKLPTVVETVLHEVLHQARNYAGIPNTVEMNVHIFQHHSQLLTQLLESMERIANLEKQQADFSAERETLQKELIEMTKHLRTACAFLRDNNFHPPELPESVMERFTGRAKKPAV